MALVAWVITAIACVLLLSLLGSPYPNTVTAIAICAGLFAFVVLEMNVSADDFGQRDQFSHFVADFPFVFGGGLATTSFIGVVVEGFARLAVGATVIGWALLGLAILAYFAWQVGSEDCI